MNPSFDSHPCDFAENFKSPGWPALARTICEKNDITCSRLERADSSDHVVFLIDDDLVLKIFRPSRNCFERELKALELVYGKVPFDTPKVLRVGRIDGLDYMIMTQVSGNSMRRDQFLDLSKGDQVHILSELADGMRTIHKINPHFVADDWTPFVHDRADTFVDRQTAHGVNPQIIGDLPAFLKKHLDDVPMKPTVFLHGDVHLGNLRFAQTNGRPKISGLFDFSDSRRGFPEYDLLAVGVLVIQGQRDLQREFLRAYGYDERELNETMRRRLMMLTMLYETCDLRRYAQRLSPDAVDLSLADLETAIWNFV